MAIAPPNATIQAIGRASSADHARHAPANAIALVSATRLGFQMNVDSSTALAETAIRAPAANPAIGPPIDRASHHVTATAATPASAISAVTATGSAADSHAAGART